MASEIQLIQLRRILGAGSELTPETAPALISANAAAVAETFFHEAAANDDVTSTKAALDYLESRLSFFADLIDHGAATRIRTRFSERVATWEA